MLGPAYLRRMTALRIRITVAALSLAAVLSSLYFFAPRAQSDPVLGGVEGLIPWPSSVQSIADAPWTSEGSWKLETPSEFSVERQVIIGWAERAQIQVAPSASTGLAFLLDSSNFVGEAYRLEVDSLGARLTAGTMAGLFRAWTTLRQMIPPSCEQGCPQGFVLPANIIEDAPAFSHRGLLLDCCRHFMSVEFVKHSIDLLALHKMNVLHWHLTEDQGWRIEIDAFPKLTEVGAYRTDPDGTSHGGFYSKTEIREIVAYAAARHIEVIPEIELPGHSQAALAAYPHLGCTGDSLPVANRWGVFKDIYCAGNDTTLAFLRTVLDEVVELFPSPRIHIGGDEAPKMRWEECPKCQSRIASEGLHDEHELQRWFIEQMGAHLAKRGRTIVGWDEILEGGLPRGATVQSWRGMAGAEQGVALGADVIVSPTSHCYLDYPLRSTDLAEVYGFNPAPASLAAGPGRVLGGECNMWTEHAPQELVDSKVYPRAIALAEVLWSGPTVTGAPDALAWFLGRIDAHYARLDALDVDYGLETVPVTLQVEPADLPGQIKVTPRAAMRNISGEAVWISAGDEQALGPLEESITLAGEGVLRVDLSHRGQMTGSSESFFLSAHAGNFCALNLDFEPSPYYPGSGPGALLDGRIGSVDFRDGNWQAVQGEDLSLTVDLGRAVALAQLSTQFYLYQDAWIFTPRELRWSTSVDANTWVDAALDRRLVDPFAPDSSQTPTSFSSVDLAGRLGRYVRMEAVNAGPCPDWHAAARLPSWLFCDELVVREVE